MKKSFEATPLHLCLYEYKFQLIISKLDAVQQ